MNKQKPTSPLLLTTAGGNPVAGNQNVLTAGPCGRLLMQDHQRSRAKH
jgi:catalase